AAGEVEDDEVILLQLRETLDKTGDSVSGFERRNNAFRAREQARGIESGLIGDGGIFGEVLVGEPGMLGPDGGIVEPGGNRMSSRDLAVFILQDVSVSSLKNP